MTDANADERFSDATTVLESITPPFDAEDRGQMVDAVDGLATCVDDATTDTVAQTIDEVSRLLDALGPAEMDAQLEQFVLRSLSLLSAADATDARPVIAQFHSAQYMPIVSETAGQILDGLPDSSESTERDTAVDLDQIAGLCLVPGDDDRWHVIPRSAIDAQGGALRIPGITYEAHCGRTIAPVSAQVIFEESHRAKNSVYESCASCIESLKDGAENPW